MDVLRPVFEALNLQVLQRGWLSSNNILFVPPHGPCAVVDTGYASHSEQTVALLEAQLQGRPLQSIVNTHLHSDHCGGNADLQRRWPECRTSVPQGALQMAQSWDEDRLSFRLTGQRCERFSVQGFLQPGSSLELGGHEWQIHATGGHDEDAVVLFEPSTRVLISGDALWRRKVAVIFPELAGEAGFAPALQALDLIEALNPSIVIPGHDTPFTEVADALKLSRQRLHRWQNDPAAHARHAARVLMMFHMMELQACSPDELKSWFSSTPMAQRAHVQGLLDLDAQGISSSILDSLLQDGALVRAAEQVRLAS